MTLITSIVKAVLSHDSVTAQQFVDVANHGADGGTCGGFIYYADTVAFFDKNETLINELIQDSQSEIYGDDVTVFDMLKGFGRGGDLETESVEFSYDEEYNEYSEDVEFSNDVVWLTPDYDNCGMKAIVKDSQYKNLMAWFALEEAARYIETLLEDKEIDVVEGLGVDCEEWKEYNL